MNKCTVLGILVASVATNVLADADIVLPPAVVDQATGELVITVTVDAPTELRYFYDAIVDVLNTEQADRIVVQLSPSPTAYTLTEYEPPPLFRGTFHLAGVGDWPADTLLTGDGANRILNLQGAEMGIDNMTVMNFGEPEGSGGLFTINDGTITVTNTRIEDTFAGADGGVFNCDGTGAAFIVIDGVIIQDTSSGNQGFGSVVNLSNPNCKFVASNSQLGTGLSGTSAVHAPQARLAVAGSLTIVASNDAQGRDAFWVTSPLTLQNSVITDEAAFATSPLPATSKTACEDFGTQSVTSLGYNLASDDSCAPTAPGDIANASPGLIERADGVLAINAASPAAEAGTEAINLGYLPCGYRDIRGLGRPQDLDGDGTFTCDIGAFEVQGGADIGAPQTGIYFDPDRPGEGFSLDVLPDGRVLVGIYTYGPDGGLAWLTGIGRIVGNSVVIDRLSITTGGAYGDALVSSNIGALEVGRGAVVFPTCQAENQPGRLMFQRADLLSDEGFLDTITVARSLTRVLDCNGFQANPATARSGSFFAPNRAGEGLIVHVLPDNRAIVVWYFYDSDGNQAWAASSSAQLQGDRITAAMVYPAGTTRFGESYLASEVVLQPFGTITIDYSGDDAMRFQVMPTAPGFSPVDYDYIRLTSLAGVSR